MTDAAMPHAGGAETALIDLYTDASPNGYKATIALEELGLHYRLHHVRVDAGEQRRPDYLVIHPHGRIPALVDREAGITIFESAAILLYLADRTGCLMPHDAAGRWAAITWLMFQSATVGPLLGQRVHFEMFEPQPPKPAIDRYRALTDDAFATLDRRLATHPFLAGEAYSIADVATFGWTHIAAICGFDFSRHAHLSSWHARIGARPAVRRGIAIPSEATEP